MAKKTNEDPMQEKELLQSGDEYVLVDGSMFWNFEEEPVFTGQFHSDKLNDDGELIGFLFKDKETGTEYIIPNNHAVEKALNTPLQGKMVRDYENMTLKIQFLEKVTLKNGQPFKRYRISVLTKG